MGDRSIDRTGGGMGTTYRYELTSDRYLAALALGNRWLFAQPQVRRANRISAGTSTLVWMVLGATGALLMRDLSPGDRMTLLGLFVVALLLTVVLIRRTQQVAFRLIAAGAEEMGGQVVLVSDDEGLVFTQAQGASRIAWSAILSVGEGPGLLLIQLRNFSLVPVPDSAFPDGQARRAFQAMLAERVAAAGPASPIMSLPGARAGASISPAAGFTPVGPGPGLLRDLFGHLGRGARLLFLLSPGAGQLRVSWTPLMLLGLLSVLVPSLDALVREGLSGQFAAYALPGALFHLPVLALAAWALALLAGRGERTLDLLLALLAMAFCLDGVVALSYNLAEDLWEMGGDLAYQIPNLWLGLAGTVAAIRLLGMEAGRGLAALVLASLTLSLPLGSVYRDRALWEEAEDASQQALNERRWNALVSEDNYYLQPRLLERQLAQLQPGRPGMAELFFVGLAGDAGQDVFMKEVRAVEQLFRERFGTAGHSLSLINNPASVRENPIASATSLERTLERVAQAMNGEEDILFLYLSSHGGEDHRLQLDFWPLRFNPLDPRRLRAMLDRAGIQRRVVVVSACYSGGFVEALRDEYTLVITAAAPDRQSFGCDNRADFTYFGKAYFDEALRRTHSFTQAFDLARVRIAERERKEGEKPSEPRLFLGGGLRQPLEDFAREQASRQDLATPASAPALR